jgi:N-acetylmuramoyl-L-alanine amidase
MNSSINIKVKLKERKETKSIVICTSNTTRKQRNDVFDIHRGDIENGKSCIGNHFIIEKDGTLRSGRPLKSVGVHDATSIGVCMVGGVGTNGETDDNFIDAQYKTLQTLVIMLQDTHPDASITSDSVVDTPRIETHIR